MKMKYETRKMKVFPFIQMSGYQTDCE